MQKGEKLVERIETLGEPGLREIGEDHAGVAALRTATATTDLAGHDQRANAALRQIVVGGDGRILDKAEEFILMTEQTLAQSATRMGGNLRKLCPQVHGLLLEG